MNPLSRIISFHTSYVSTHQHMKQGPKTDTQFVFQSFRMMRAWSRAISTASPHYAYKIAMGVNTTHLKCLSCRNCRKKSRVSLTKIWCSLGGCLLDYLGRPLIMKF